MSPWVARLSYLLVSAIASSAALGQTTPIVTMDKVMTADELKASGLDALTLAQRSALDEWLSAYTVKLIRLAQRPEKPTPSTSLGAGSRRPTYTGPNGGHWIRSNANNGAMITLEDGSIWEINSIDRIDTSLWLPITDITVLRAPQAVGNYTYLLVNKEDGEKALAKFLGKE
jgi:hypothetical protein